MEIAPSYMYNRVLNTPNSDAYIELSQISLIEIFMKIVNVFVCLCSIYASGVSPFDLNIGITEKHVK